MAGAIAHNAALGNNITVTLSCSDSSVKAQQFMSDMSEITITPTLTFNSKHPIGADLPHEQQTMEYYECIVRGEVTGNIIAFQAAAKSSAARRGSRATPTYTMGIDCDAGENGNWSLTLKQGTYRGGPMHIGQQNAAITQEVNLRFMELDVGA